jgi:hypothetical protein
MKENGKKNLEFRIDKIFGARPETREKRRTEEELSERNKKGDAQTFFQQFTFLL